MAEFNSYLLGKARKSVGNLTIVYAKGKNNYAEKRTIRVRLKSGGR
jgi:hypothetical protein